MHQKWLRSLDEDCCTRGKGDSDHFQPLAGAQPGQAHPQHPSRTFLRVSRWGGCCSRLFSLQTLRIRPQQLHTNPFSTTRKPPEATQISRNMEVRGVLRRGGLQFIPFCINFSESSVPAAYGLGGLGMLLPIIPLNSCAFVTYSTQDAPSGLAIGGMKCEERSGKVKLRPSFF